jgi:bacterioferritin
MKGAQEVIDRLNELLVADQTAADLYLYCARQLYDRGYGRLAAHFQHEWEHERQHAELQIDRILFLEGEPKVLVRQDVPMPTTVKEMLEQSLRYETEVAAKLNEAIVVCDTHHDGGTRVLFEKLLQETEEDHIHWLEGELHVLNTVGEALYLQQQYENPAPDVAG